MTPPVQTQVSEEARKLVEAYGLHCISVGKGGALQHSPTSDGSALLSYIGKLERDAERLAILDCLIREDRVVVDNNTLPPVLVYLNDESDVFDSLAAAGEAAITQDYPGKPVRAALTEKP